MIRLSYVVSGMCLVALITTTRATAIPPEYVQSVAIDLTSGNVCDATIFLAKSKKSAAEGRACVERAGFVVLGATIHSRILAIQSRFTLSCTRTDLSVLRSQLSGCVSKVAHNTIHSRSNEPQGLFYTDFQKDNYLAMHIQAAWTIAEGTAGQGIIIAVLDTGASIQHEGLVPNIWKNSLEYSGTPGVDDDGNGYTDDLHGWNFNTIGAGDHNLVDVDPDGHGTQAIDQLNLSQSSVNVDSP